MRWQLNCDVLSARRCLWQTKSTPMPAACHIARCSRSVRSDALPIT
jgi:hypothetical protein